MNSLLLYLAQFWVAFRSRHATKTLHPTLSHAWSWLIKPRSHCRISFDDRQPVVKLLVRKYVGPLLCIVSEVKFKGFFYPHWSQTQKTFQPQFGYQRFCQAKPCSGLQWKDQCYLYGPVQGTTCGTEGERAIFYTYQKSPTWSVELWTTSAGEAQLERATFILRHHLHFYAKHVMHGWLRTSEHRCDRSMQSHTWHVRPFRTPLLTHMQVILCLINSRLFWHL